MFERMIQTIFFWNCVEKKCGTRKKKVITAGYYLWDSRRYIGN